MEFLAASGGRSVAPFVRRSRSGDRGAKTAFTSTPQTGQNVTARQEEREGGEVGGRERAVI